MRLAALALIASTTTGCIGVLTFGDIDGGDTVTQTREVEDFEAIALVGSIDVRAKVGPAQSVEVEADESVIDEIETVVEDGVLEVRLKKGLRLNPGRMRVTVTAPSLSGVRVSGSGDAVVEGIEGGGFETSISGSGDIELAGEASSLSVAIAGSGDVDARGLQVETATVKVSGSGDVRVSATETVSGAVSGSGDVSVHGGASCTVAVSGSGDVRC